MPGQEHPEPLWRASRNCYFVQIGKRQHRLSPDRDEVYRLYHELMSRPPERRQQPIVSASPLVVEVIDAFLE